MAQSDEPSHLHIAPEGDIILVVGEHAAQKKIQVYSCILKLASRVFAAMLGPHFAEGQRISSIHPGAIALPDDDVDAMVEICEVLHHRYTHIEHLPEVDKIYNIASTADKYECTYALRPTFAAWMTTFEPDNRYGQCRYKINDLFKLMAATYIFDDARGFKKVTTPLVMHYTENYVMYFDKSISSFVPLKCLGN